MSLPLLSPIGSPLQFFVDAVNSGVVTAYGPGLSYGMVNKATTFTVVTKNAGEGTIPHSSSDTCYCQAVLVVILLSTPKSGHLFLPLRRSVTGSGRSL